MLSKSARAGATEAGSGPVTLGARGGRGGAASKSRRGGLQYKLDSGPKGMTLSPTGLLEWNVPSDSANPQENVIVTIRDKSGQEVFHTFQITIE